MFKSLSKNAATLAVGVAIAFAGLTAWNWYHPSKILTAIRVAPTKPYDAPQSRLERNLEAVVVPTEIVTLRPTQKQRKKIEGKLDAPLPDTNGKALLGLKDIEPLPYGGTGILVLEPQPDGTSAAVLRIYPSKPPFFEFTPERSLGAYYGVGFGQLGGRVWNIEFEQHLFRLGPAEFSARAGVLSSQIATDGYVMVGAKATF